MIRAIVAGAILIFFGAMWPKVGTGRLIALAGVSIILMKWIF